MAILVSLSSGPAWDGNFWSSGLGRIADVFQTEAGVTVDEGASDGQTNGKSEVDENGGEAHDDEGDGW